MRYSRQQLEEAASRGEETRFLFFWGHRPGKDGRVTASCLSQWWEAPFEVDGVRYGSAEHFMMAEKARLFGDEETRAQIIAAADPAAAKALGRKVRGFDEAAWVRERAGIVVRGNLAKFGQHPELRAFLLASGDQVLVEASPTDPIWGIGLAESDPRASSPREWQGLNLLGFALMEVRAELATGSQG